MQFEFAAPVGADLDRFQRFRSCFLEFPVLRLDSCVGKCFDGLQAPVAGMGLPRIAGVCATTTMQYVYRLPFVCHS